MAQYRPLTGTVYRIDGGVWANARCAISQNAQSWDGAGVYPADLLDFRTTAEGEVPEDVMIRVNSTDSQAAPYVLVTPDARNSAPFYVEPGDGPVSLSHLLGMGTAAPDTLGQQIRDYVDGQLDGLDPLPPGGQVNQVLAVTQADPRETDWVTLTGGGGPIGLDDLTDVDTGGAEPGQVLGRVAGGWAPVDPPPSEGGLTPEQAQQLADAYQHSQEDGNPHGATAGDVGADPAGTAGSAVSAHDDDEDAHPALRARIDALESTPAPDGNATALQGRPVADAQPANGQVLKWTGAAWAPAADATGDGGAGAVQSVNGQTGDVSLTASDVGAEPAGSVEAHDDSGTAHADIRAAVSAAQAAAIAHADGLTAQDVGADPAGTASTAVGAHAGDTTDVHGIADTAALVLTDDPRLSNARTPTGGAGGVLSGSYPSPGFAEDMATQAELDSAIAAEAFARQASDSALDGAIQSHASSTNNPHTVTKSQVGLGNVDNTSDAAKPISSATQTALDAKASLTTTKGVVVHGSTASTARPAGYASVEWIGSVAPTNRAVNDTWIDTST